MGLLAFELARGRELDDGDVIGFIGLGKVNSAVARVLRVLRGVTFLRVLASSEDSSIRANERLTDEGYASLVAKRGSLLWKDCSVVYTATTAHEKSQVFRVVDLPGVTTIVAFDSGYLLGPDFREKFASVSDYPEQSLLYATEEFPYDRSARYSPYSLLEVRSSFPTIVAYLYGVALADIVVASVAWEEGLLR